MCQMTSNLFNLSPQKRTQYMILYKIDKKNNNSHRQIGNNSIEKIQQKTIRRV